MNKQLIYSILQYKHSSFSREVLNIGVLFYFPDDIRKIYFYYTNPARLKCLYPDIDLSYFKTILKDIEYDTCKYSTDILAVDLIKDDFEYFIDSYLLKNDDSSLQFTEKFISINIYPTIEEAVKEYTCLLFPYAQSNENKSNRHDEGFIIQKFKNRLLRNNPELNTKINKGEEVNIGNLNFKFDIAWQNGTYNLVKSVGFDLQEESGIQKKTAEYCSYLLWLDSYVKTNNCRIDLLLSKPKESRLQKIYSSSLELLHEIPSNKKIIEFDEIENYADEVGKYLLSS